MKFTRLAIATSDGTHMSEHMARSTGWVVLDIENGQVLSRTLRSRPGEDGGRHATFVDMLTGCDAVICGGIGIGAASALTAAGIEPLVAARPLTIDRALREWLAGTLVPAAERDCLYSH